MFSIQWWHSAIDVWSQWEPICSSGEEFATLFLFWQYVKSLTLPLQPGSLFPYWGTHWNAASNPTGTSGKTSTGFHGLWMKPWSGTPFPVVLWVKSYCVEREEYVDSWRTDSLLWCLGTHYGHYITSRVFTPSTLGTDIPWLCTATSHLSWSKQVRRNKPESRTSGCLASLRLGHTLTRKECQWPGRASSTNRFHPCCENTGHQLAWPWSTRAPGAAFMDLITSVNLEQTLITGDTLHADKSYLGAIQRVFMDKCLHKLLRSNVA